MSEKMLAEMKWNEIPSETPMYEILQAIGFPEPMIILKHLNKPQKKGKKHDLSSTVSFLWTTKEEIQNTLHDWYEFVSDNDSIRKYLTSHPKQALLLINTWKQFNEEPLSVVAERNLNQWRQLLIEEGVWESLMQETPLTLIERVMKMFTETDYLNMSLSEYWATYEVEGTLEKASLKAMADKFVEAEEKEQQMKKLRAELEAAGLGNLSSLFKEFGMGL